MNFFTLTEISYFTWHPTSDQGNDEVDSDEDHSGHDHGDHSDEVRDDIHGVHDVRGVRVHVHDGKEAHGVHSGVVHDGKHDEQVDSDGHSDVAHSGDHGVRDDIHGAHDDEGSGGRGALSQCIYNKKYYEERSCINLIHTLTRDVHSHGVHSDDRRGDHRDGHSGVVLSDDELHESMNESN